MKPWELQPWQHCPFSDPTCRGVLISNLMCVNALPFVRRMLTGLALEGIHYETLGFDRYWCVFLWWHCLGNVRLSTCFLLTFLLAQVALAAPTDDFVTTWKTDNPGTSNSTSITVPMIGGPYDVDWDNDGVFDQFGITDSVTHDFGVAGTYTIRIFGSYDSIRFA